MTPRLAVHILLLSVCVVGSGCAASGLSRARQADALHDYDAAVAQYSKVLRDHPDNRDAQLGLQRAKLRASEAHLARGRRLFAVGRYADAALELQIASDLNPTNGDAERDLRAARLAVREQLAAPPEGRTALEALLARARGLPAEGHALPDMKLPGEVVTGAQATSRQIYLAIARLANLSVLFDQGFIDAPAPASLLSADLTIEAALDAVARSTRTFYQVSGPGTITVVSDTPAKRREYTEESEQVFFVQNADLKETVDALRIVNDIRSISQISGINAILVRDTPERLEVAARMIDAFDKARAEIVVDVEILEVDRTKLMDYGLQIASPPASAGGVPIGVSGIAAIDETGLTLENLGNLTRANVLLAGVPALYYRLLKTDTNTRTLANTNVRVSDGVTARTEFGERIPTPNATIGAIAAGGVGTVPITQYTYQNVGVNIAITPRVHPNDEVSLGLDIELSNVQGTGFGGLPTFGSRRVATTLRLKDAETNILAGLIREDERFVRDGMPGLSDVPGLSRLFTRNRREATETDVVIMLTPHIVRTLQLTEADLRPLKLPREGSTGAFIDLPPSLPAPPIRDPGLPGGGLDPVEPAPSTAPPSPIQPSPAPPVIIR
jgi:general secretion pathway protein D